MDRTHIVRPFYNNNLIYFICVTCVIIAFMALYSHKKPTSSFFSSV